MPVRTNKNHLKFELFTDEQIGFCANNPVVSAANLIPTDADEDYETDAEILRRTIAVCKRDVLFALKTMQAHPHTYQLKLSNNSY